MACRRSGGPTANPSSTWLMRVFPVLTLLAAVPFALADEPGPARSRNPPAGSEFRVVTVSTISGELLAPVAKDKPPERIKIAGKSSIDYVERILPVDAKDADFKSLRVYEKIDFRKTAGDRTDEMTLRPAVRRLVLMKKGTAQGPVLAGRPADVGRDRPAPHRHRRPGPRRACSPTSRSSPGDTWKASAAAVAELTDLEKVEKGELTCGSTR